MTRTPLWSLDYPAAAAKYSQTTVAQDWLRRCRELGHQHGSRLVVDFAQAGQYDNIRMAEWALIYWHRNQVLRHHSAPTPDSDQQFYGHGGRLPSRGAIELAPPVWFLWYPVQR